MGSLRHLWSLLSDVVEYAWRERIWWLLPMVLALLALGGVVVATGAAAPFLYTLF